MWCRECGALIGLRQPFDDWAADATGLCPQCAGKLMRERDQPQPREATLKDGGERQPPKASA
jgi:hypothetical protein